MFNSCQTEDIGDCAENESYIAVEAEIITARRAIMVGNKTKDCQICRKPIPPERLEFIPGALHCSPCQGKVDANSTFKRLGMNEGDYEEESELTADEEEFAKKVIIAQHED